MSEEDLDTPIDESMLRGEDQKEEVVEEKEADTTAQEVVEEKEVDDKPKPERDQMIPRSRFDEVYRQAKEREEENERLRALLEEKKNPAVTPDIKSMRHEAYQAMIEGDSDKYAEISEQIDREIMARAKAEAKAEVEADMNTRETLSKLESVAAKAMSDYPFLSPETGDSQAIDEVIGWRDMYIAKGMQPHETLSRAVNRVAPLYIQSPPTEVARDERTGKALERSIKAAEKQPPATSQIGVGQRGEDKVFDVANIVQADWEKMSEDERKKLLSA